MTSLDVIRGFALVGVLAVNAPYFAAPLVSVINPLYGPLSVAKGGTWAWALPYVLFEYKSIALFSMLFGASLFMVGGERDDAQGARRLRRRLGWLALFGILHGVVLWFGDILLSYALAGLLVMRCRSWRPPRLFVVGIMAFLISMGLIAAIAAMIARMSPSELAAFSAGSWSPPPSRLAAEVASYRESWAAAFMANLAAWGNFQIEALLLLTPRTAGLMMIGLALFKTEFLTGSAPTHVYRRWLAIGACALAALVWNGWDIVRQGFPLLRMQVTGTLVTASLAPLVSLGYASALILILRAGVLRPATQLLAAMGRMAFTNYLTHSIVLSSLFWGGRGRGLYGALSRPQLGLVVVALFAAQAAFSLLWLQRFDHGPFEWVWRRLSRANLPPRPAASCHTPPAVETDSLTKRFGKHVAVFDVHLRVPAGAIFAFIGPNGAGKTTTIRILLGLMRPSSGKARIFGHDVLQDRQGAARHVGALLEARATYDHLSGLENLDITRRLLGQPTHEIDRVLGLVGLRDVASRRVSHYSLGMRQRLGLARALIGSPRLLLLDEPMNGLDPQGISEMRRTIRGLPGETGVTVFLSSHLLDEVEQVATHIGLMRGGRLIAQGPLAELLGRSGTKLLLRTDNDGRALDVLRSGGFDARSEPEGICVPGRETDAGNCARLLVSAGLDLRALTPRRADLESLYLNLTEQGAT
jgi:ABC-type multidrug transport system ATPase subunit/uncharacterized membrane protein YeiB